MNQKILIISLISLVSLSFSTVGFAAGSCIIESGPIPELAEYIRDVDARIIEIKNLGNQAGPCGITPAGASANAERTTEVIEMAFLKIPLFNNLFLDFLYNIQIAANGETRTPVLRDGQIFSNLEKKIVNALSTVTNQCHLSDPVKAGFTTLLQENQILENIYKQAALGTPTSNYFGLSSKNVTLANAISMQYIPPATESCKNQNSMENLRIKFLALLESLGAKNESALADWKKGIELFQGGGGGGTMTVTEYTNIQRKLLRQELARQGFSPRMSAAMLSNFDCVKAKSSGSATAETQTQSEQICLVNPILSIENIVLPWRTKVVEAPTTDKRVEQVNELSREERVKIDIVNMESLLKLPNTPTIDTKLALMLDLIDLHIELLMVSERIEKRVPMLYVDCMKGQPVIPCPKIYGGEN